jgi:uncharacterized lipoprotein YddW (UPF0748 family)
MLAVQQAGVIRGRIKMKTLNICVLIIFIYTITFCNIDDTIYQTRVVWVDQSEYSTQKKADKVIHRTLKSHMNVIMPQVYNHGYTSYQSTFIPMLPKAQKNRYDPLGYILKKAHEVGLEVHAWFCIALLPVEDVEPLLRENPDFGARAPGDDDWQYFKRTKFVIANIHNNEFQEFIINMMIELIMKYDIDGLQYDYIRAVKTSYDNTSEKEFQEKFGKRLIDATTDELHTWHAEAVENIVKRTTEKARKIRPEIIISAAIDPDIEHIWPQGQDSRKWAREKIVDLVITMDYEMTPELVQLFETNYAKQIPNSMHGVGLGTCKPILGGIFYGSRSPKLILSQLEVLNNLNIKHIALFRHAFNNYKITRALVNGPFNEKAKPYYRKKK